MPPPAARPSIPGGADGPDAARDGRLADLADLVLTVARKIQAAPRGDAELVTLTPLEAIAMQFIDRNPGVRASELSSELGQSSSNTSYALRELEGKGMIRREPDPADRRVVRIHATERARTNLSRLRLHWAGLLGRLDADPHRLDEAIALLEAADTALSAAGSQPPRRSTAG